jgi:pimeloyl-ACP methyl ester carboxylesterase
VELAYRELGRGRPLVLLHGFAATGLQWIHHGPAAALAGQGHRVILPDLRGHGDSAGPHPPQAYRPDILTDDGLALTGWLGLDDYDLGGYSLGGRIALRMLVRGARPARTIVAGQGLDSITRTTGRGDGYRRVLTALVNGDPIEPGSPDAQQAYWMTYLGGDPQALLHALNTDVATPADALPQITAPTLVAIGDQDPANPSAAALAAALPNSSFTRVPGDHFTALGTPDLATAILAFLTDHHHDPASPDTPA